MSSTGPSTFGAAWQVAQYLFLFALVLGLAYLFSRSLRRLVPFTRSRHLRVLDQLHLGPSRSFYLLAVAGKVVLVAMGEGGVATVATLDDPDLVADLLRQPEQPAPAAVRQNGQELLSRLAGLGRLAVSGGRSVPGSFAQLLEQAQHEPAAATVPKPAAAAAPHPQDRAAPPPEDALRRQVERLRRLADRTGTEG